MYNFAAEYRRKIKSIILECKSSQQTTTTPSNGLPKLKLMLSQNDVLHHPFGKTLQNYALHGCPVNCSPNWTKEQIEQTVKDGPNELTRDPLAAQCFHNKIGQHCPKNNLNISNRTR